MSKEKDEFIKEGIQRYKQATNIYFTFRKELQDKLQNILRKRKQWARLNPDFQSIKSTTFGQDYPLLNARINCSFDDEVLTIVIAVNWYQSETDFPFFTVWLENGTGRQEKLERFEWNESYKFIEKSLRFYPDPESYNLEKDFEALLDEFIRYFDKIETL